MSNLARVDYKSRYQTLAKTLVQYAPQIDELLRPQGQDVARFNRIVLSSVRRQPKLLECEITSVVQSAMAGAELGLDVGGVLGEAYLVPFWNNKKRRNEAQFVSGYKGLVKLATQHPRIVNVEAVLVRDGEPFEHERGTTPRILHRPQFGPGREIVAAYAIAWFDVPGRFQVEVMDRDELLDIKRAALSKFDKAANREWLVSQSTWTKHEGEMMRKSPLRRLCKTLPLSEKLKRCLEVEEEASAPSTADPLGGARTADIKERLASVANEAESIQDADFEEEADQ